MTSMAFRDEVLHAVLGLAAGGEKVIPLWGKLPAIPNPHPKGSWERQNCHGECGRYGHGFYDATSDPVVVAYWWAYLTPGANVGARVREDQFVLDVDPRSGGHESLAALILNHGPLPETLTTISGRGDGGTHLFYRHPGGKLSPHLLGGGIDVKTSLGYTVVPPSYHPDTGRQYTRIERSVVDPPAWLADLVTTPEPEPAVTGSPRSLFSSFWSPSSVADEFAETTSWAEILEPCGWRCLDANPDCDGAAWLHPTHTSACSASIRFGCLFVWSTNTPFTISEPGNTHGYTKFRAYAVLYHDGDMSAAARALREAS